MENHEIYRLLIVLLSTLFDVPPHSIRPGSSLDDLGLRLTGAKRRKLTAQIIRMLRDAGVKLDSKQVDEARCVRDLAMAIRSGEPPMSVTIPLARKRITHGTDVAQRTTSRRTVARFGDSAPDLVDLRHSFERARGQDSKPAMEAEGDGGGEAATPPPDASDFEGLFATRGEPSSAETAAPTAAPLERYFNVRKGSSAVRVGDTLSLRVWVGTEAVLTGGGSSQFAGGRARLSIDVEAPGFSFHDEPQTQHLDVPETGDSEQIRFELQALKEGLQRIEVSAWNKSAKVGGVILEIPVGMPAVKRANEPIRDRLDMREPELGEYTLEVQFDTERSRYTFRLRNSEGHTWPSFEGTALDGGNTLASNALIRALNEQARNLGHLKPDDQKDELASLGTAVFIQAIPMDLQVVLWDNKDKIKRMNILSSGDPMPWELVRFVSANRAEGMFLAEHAAVSRWRYGAPPHKKIGAGDVFSVLPTNAPEKAREEMAYIHRRLGGGRVIDDLTMLKNELKIGRFGVLHFASHNAPGDATALQTYIPMSGSKFTATSMNLLQDDLFATSAPLVFMNACTSAGSLPLISSLAGWATEFLRCGAGAFLGTLWEVRDKSASIYAQAFYDSFTSNLRIGEAMQHAREHLDPGDPTRYAYTLYGNPNALRS